MKAQAPLSTLRREVEQLFRKYRAIRILTNSLTGDERREYDRALDSLIRLPRERLKNWRPELKEEVKRVSTHFGVIGKLRDLEALANDKPSTLPPPGEKLYCQVSKHRLEQLFKHYERALPCFPDLPPHGRVAIDILGVREEKGYVVILQLDVSLFQDMAFLWNATLEQLQSLADGDNVASNRVKAFNRATAKAAFNLLEGYLNAMALDILLTDNVTLAQEIKLTEWDKERSRQRWLKLRDKLLQYPKIALRSSQPPLDEGNCPEMARVLETQQRVRHSLIHPTPQIDMKNPSVFREAVFVDLSLEEVGHLCDDVVELIFKLCDAINHKFGRVDLWLHRRDPTTGRFPDEAFI